MTPLLPPCPSLTDSRSTPARCISTGDLRRYTVKEVRFKTQFKIKIHTRCFNCELGRDQSDVVGFTFLVTWACFCGWYSGLHIIVRIECAWHYKGDCPGLRQECGVTLSASFISLARVRYAEVPRRCTGAPFVHRIYRGQCFAQHCCYIILCETSSRASASNQMS